MGIYIEALILYILLFPPVSNADTLLQLREFSSLAECVKILMRSLPSLILVWYLILRSNGKDLTTCNINGQTHLHTGIIIKKTNLPVFNRKDFVSILITLPCLILTGFFISFLSSKTGAVPENILISSPSNITGWIVLTVSCFISAYLEESYFRYYLFSKKDQLKLSVSGIFVLSVILFSLCHVYAGFWGFINALIGGTILSIIYIKFNAIHGIAISHALYNLLAYILNAVYS